MRLEPGRIVLLDQTRLPSEEVHAEVRDWPELVEAITRMAVRGAPSLGVAGAMGVALAAGRSALRGEDAQREEIARAAAALRIARPTAVNLADAVDAQAALAGRHPGPPAARAEALAAAARALQRAETERGRAIGRAARELIAPGARVLTHCNAGALATAGHGTATAVIVAAHADDPTVSAVVGETRPLLQGARLTAWELGRAGVPYTLIADGAAAAMMAAGRVSHVVVGADRIARNGDVVNKIGTYALALLAAAHDLPFVVAAPTTTLDRRLATGSEVPIEERDPDELRALGFARPMAPEGAPVANPAFDLTPARLVTAIVTERGVHRPPYERSLDPEG